MNSEYGMCTRCVMDTTANDIVFDEGGVCNSFYFKSIPED